MKKREINKTLNLSHEMGSCSVLWMTHDNYCSYEKHIISERIIFRDAIYDRAFGQGLKKKRSRPKLVAGVGQTIKSKVLEFRAYPDDEQKILFWKTIGCKRLVWNKLLDERITYAKEHEGELLDTTPAHLKEDYSFLEEVDSMALCNVQLNLNQACSATFPKGKTPKFRKRGKDRKSYTTNYINNNIEVTVKVIRDNNDPVKVANMDESEIRKNQVIECYLKLPKMGQLRIHLHRDIPTGWQIKNVTLKETSGGRFYVSIGFDAIVDDVEDLKEFEKVEAIDYSSTNLMVSYSGLFDILVEQLHWYRNLEDRIAVEQRKLSRMVKGSNNYRKQCYKIGKLQEKASDRRKDFLHKLSRLMADMFDAVILEDINLAEMARRLTSEEREKLIQAGMKPVNLGKATLDNGFGMFRTMLAYKMRDLGKIPVKVDRFFPSSQLCSSCGYKNEAVKDLSIREWTCPECGAHHDRDKNACANLLQEGMKLLNRWASGDSSLMLNPQGFLSEKKPHLLQDGE